MNFDSAIMLNLIFPVMMPNNYVCIKPTELGARWSQEWCDSNSPL